MKSKFKMAAAVAVAALMSVPASAGSLGFSFVGSGVSGYVTLTYDVNPLAGGPLGTSPNVFDPVGSYVITGATGALVNANIGLSTTITGVVAASPSNPEPSNLLAPASFGHYIVTDGIMTPSGLAPGFSYDNLFYPGGSPQAASDYPFHGGFLDIYGLVFTTADSIAVNFWSNGDFGAGANYGAGFTDGKQVLDYVGDITVSVPEPASWAMMIGGFALAGAALRSRKTTLRFA